jgi:hypothetical protein
LSVQCNDDTGDTSWEAPEEWNDKLASIPPLAVLTSEDDAEPGSLTALVQARAGTQVTKPGELASTAREPQSPDSRPSEQLQSSSISPAVPTASADAELEKKAGIPAETNMLKTLESMNQEKVWFVYRDMESLMQYFVNAKSGESQWEPPLEIAAQVMEHDAAGVQPGEWQLYINKEDPEQEPDDCVAIVKGWEVYQDRTTGRWYYYNPESGGTQWDAPDDVLQAAPEDWEAGGAQTDADGNVLEHGGDAEPADDEVLTADQSAAEAGVESEEEHGQGITEADLNEALQEATEEASNMDAIEVSITQGAIIVRTPDVSDKAETSAACENNGSAQKHQPTTDKSESKRAGGDEGLLHDVAAVNKRQHGEEQGDSVPLGTSVSPAKESPPRAAAPLHSSPTTLRSRSSSHPRSRPPSRPPTAGGKKSK